MKQSLRLFDNQRGQALIGALMASAIGAIAMLALSHATHSQYVGERGVASNLDLDELNREVLMLLDNPKICAMSGLLGVNLSSLVQPIKDKTPVISLSLKFGPISIAEGSVIGGIRNITAVNLYGVVATGDPGSYIGTLQVSTTVLGKATTSREPQLKFAVHLILDASNAVVGCGGSGSTAPPVLPVGTPWSFIITHDNKSGPFWPVGKYFQNYTVPVGKTLVIQTVNASIDQGWVSCSAGNAAVDTTNVDDFALTSAKNDPGLGTKYISMSHSQIFPGGYTVRFGGQSGKPVGSGTIGFYTCKFLGFLYDSTDYSAPGDFIGFNAFDAPTMPSLQSYTVPAGKTLVLTGLVGGVHEAGTMDCRMGITTPTGYTLFEVNFPLYGGAVPNGIMTPALFGSGTKIDFTGQIQGAMSSPTNYSRCSWSGYLQ